MSNQSFSTNQKAEIISLARNLMARRAALMERDFPLTENEIADAILPKEIRSTFQYLRTIGVDSLTTSRQLHAVVEGLHEFPVGLWMMLPHAQWYAYREQASGMFYGGSNMTGVMPRIPFDVATLSDKSVVKLTEWLDRAVRERRLEKLANMVIKDFIDARCHSLYHLLARWPDLKMIVRKLSTTWADRIDGAPTGYRLSRWNWGRADSEWHQKHRVAMQVVGETMVSGQLLPSNTSAQPLSVSVKAWRVMDGSWVTSG